MFWSALPPEPADVLEVPTALLDEAEAAVADPAQSPERRLELLIDFVAERDQFGFRYRADATRTVAGTYASREGNCLSYTLLFLGLSRALGLDAHAREVRVPPAWQDEGQILFDVGHVNVGVDTPSRHRTVDFDPDLLRSHRLAAPWRGRPIPDQRALAHFYNNRAAELLSQRQTLLARLWVERALEMDPTFQAALNTQGVIERRLGHLDAARESFEAALELNPESASVLFNLISLAEQTDKRSDAEGYRARLDALHPGDPWFQWQLGRHYARQGRPSEALRHYRRAFELDARQPRFADALIDQLLAMDRPTEAGRVRARAERFGLVTAAPALAKAVKKSVTEARPRDEAALKQ
jgi:tetratricopeptide (TPR) repeat protein